ncbi:MAG: D-alanyl-D-alanine carboxypeptidase family protein [Chloroflexi bacterium]|nr:D-alanyl-D-alanine carboxypeptidase family protein [Chloroflexota bacterium]
MQTIRPRLRAARILAAAVLLGAGLMAVPAATPSSARGATGPLPDCRLDDILTIPRGYDDWQHTLVDWIFTVGKSYVPPDLVSLSRAGVTGGGQVRKVALNDLKAMAAAARAHGTPLGSVSSYRSYQTQVSLFNMYAKGYGFDAAILFSARPGHSEHQLGLAIDFAAAGTSTFVSGTDRTGRWLATNGWKYGWLLSYPEGKQKVVCLNYEPWHYRYYGRELAAKIHASGLTTREYLWQNFTAVDPTTGQPLATPTPVPSPTDLASPGSSGDVPTDSPLESASPSPGVSAGETPVPSSPAGTLFGLDPPALVAGLLLVLAVVGLIASVGLRRRRPGSGYRR